MVSDNWDYDRNSIVQFQYEKKWRKKREKKVTRKW